MTRLINAVRLNRNRHVLRARQRARQIAGLLGYERPQQIAISAAVFAVAYKTVVEHRTARLQFMLSDDRLLIRCARADSSSCCADIEPKRQRRPESLPDEKEEGATLPLRTPLTTRLLTFHSSPDVLATDFGLLATEYFGELVLERGFTTLSFPLPDQSPRLDAADLPWVIREMGRITPLDPLEEFYQLNRELLRLLRLTRADPTSESRGGHAA